MGPATPSPSRKTLALSLVTCAPTPMPATTPPTAGRRPTTLSPPRPASLGGPGHGLIRECDRISGRINNLYRPMFLNSTFNAAGSIVSDAGANDEKSLSYHSGGANCLRRR